MLYLGPKRHDRWEAVVFAPPREVFAVAEQVAGLPPFSFRVVDDHTAEVVQDLANGLFGQWSKVRYPKNRIRIECESTSSGTRVTITADGERSATMRATNLLRILGRGERDGHTVYHFRSIPPGPCTIVQSWAGTGYPIFKEPDHKAERGRSVRPASPLRALRQQGRWVQVRAGEEPETEVGWIEADQLVPDQAPARASA
ncbi:MAG: hypothetical protein M0027_03470 [Candidatus Dormibacteraeota bacterium]|jgi:hypothetical protein|nr:hypothetical protein [Candidatus Dormibacteraeota bacterium]